MSGHRYATPAKGTLDWHLPLNANFARLDVDVEVRDEDAARGEYDPAAGAKFLATDTGRVYLGDGDAWSLLGTIGAESGGGDTTGGMGVSAALAAGDVVAVSAAGDPVVVDVAATDTPVQDALDQLGTGGGEVYLPPTTVTEAGSIRPPSNAAVYGFGPDVSKVAIEPRDIDGVVFDDPDGVANVYLGDFALNGPGIGTPSGVAVHHARGDTQNLHVGRMVFWGWTNSVYRVEQGVGPFQCRHEQLVVYDCDAGDEDGLFEFRSWYGPANWFGTVVAYPTAGTSGRNSTVLFTRGGTQSVDYVTMGGSAGVALDQTWDAQVRVESVHWEPTDLQSTPRAIVRLRGHAPARVGRLKHVAGTCEYTYELDYDAYNGAAPARKSLGPYYASNAAATLTGGVVNLASPNDPAAPSFYFGVADDVDVTHGQAPTGGLRALGAAGTPVG